MLLPHCSARTDSNCVQAHGLTQADFVSDPLLHQKRRKIVADAAKSLDQSRLIRVDNSKNYFATDLGRVAAKFYLDYETAANFSTKINEGITDSEILTIFGESSEFQQLKVRDDENSELAGFKADKKICPFTHNKKDASTDLVSGKVAILIQTYISRARLDSFSLISDSNYILSNAGRLFRAMFEITLTRTVGASNMSERLLEWAKMVGQSGGSRPIKGLVNISGIVSS